MKNFLLAVGCLTVLSFATSCSQDSTIISDGTDKAQSNFRIGGITDGSEIGEIDSHDSLVFTESKADIIDYLETSWAVLNENYDIEDVELRRIFVDDSLSKEKYILWGVTVGGSTKLGAELEVSTVGSGPTLRRILNLAPVFAGVTCTSTCTYGCDPAAMTHPVTKKEFMTCKPCSHTDSGKSCTKTASASN